MHKGLENLTAFLDKHDKFIISTHESPDGDGLGAEIAFNELLHNLGKTSFILNSDPVPDKFYFLDIDGDITVYHENCQLPDNLGDYALVILDTNDFHNIGQIYNLIKDEIKDVFIIDHHIGDKNKFESNYIKVEASSASEIIYGIVRYYGKDVSFKSALALYTGIVFDTGSFRYPKTTPETFQIASNLVEMGVNPFKVYEHIYENNSLASFELRALMLSTMEIHHGGRLILMQLTSDMVKKTGATFNEGELNINLPLTVKGVVASVLVKQDAEGPVKVSMRTKGKYDVGKLAVENGGGGHKNAAGYKSRLSLVETRLKVLEDMKEFFQ
mgnify:CR=1 FL=1